MGSIKGNTFWKLRTKHGRDKKFSPTELEKGIEEYIDVWGENPLMETIVQSSKKFKLPKMRAMTIKGLCIFLGIAPKTFYEYCKLNDYCNITTYVKDLFYTQKFEGAAAGLLNANIIARDLGLKEESKVDTTETITFDFGGTGLQTEDFESDDS